MIRHGNSGAFDALVQRYQPRLLAFCRHMLSSQEDAEDVLQEVFAASYNALLADERPINARPWLYRIARNRCLNHLRRPRAAGQDSMDIFEIENGATTAETVHQREEFRQIVADVQELPETQRTALLLREIDALSYDQIAEAMDTTVPSVKSLLVRARVGLAEASEARLLTCDDVRTNLGEVAEGLNRTTAPVRRHLKACERCRIFRVELRSTSKALAAVFPITPLILLKKFGIAKLGLGGGAAAGSAAGSAAAGGAGLAAGGAATAAGGAAGGAISAGVGTLASKAAAGMAAAVIVTAGAVEVNHATQRQREATPAAAVAPAPTRVTPPAPKVQPAPVPAPRPLRAEVAQEPVAAKVKTEPKPPPPPPPPPAPAATPAPATPPAAVPAPPPVPAPTQEDQGTSTLPPRTTPVAPAPVPPTGNGQQPTSPQQPPTQQQPSEQPQPQPVQLTTPLP